MGFGHASELNRGLRRDTNHRVEPTFSDRYKEGLMLLFLLTLSIAEVVSHRTAISCPSGRLSTQVRWSSVGVVAFESRAPSEVTKISIRSGKLCGLDEGRLGDGKSARHSIKRSTGRLILSPRPPCPPSCI
ncbi:hypothetical protein LZ32DRAFT_362901 [Colletotrichum eremochloae]|nr:hypothetical protein LZ32DRAFT_362901 [Colletotrichum eremochloae]